MLHNPFIEFIRIYSHDSRKILGREFCGSIVPARHIVKDLQEGLTPWWTSD